MTPPSSSGDFCNLHVPRSRSGTPDRSPDRSPDESPCTTPSSPSGDGKHRVIFHIPVGVKQSQAPAAGALAADSQARASSAPASEALTERETQVLPAASASGKNQRQISPNEALRVIDEAHRRLKHQVEARAGRAHFAQPGRQDSIDPEAPDLLARLTRLRHEIHSTARLVEQSGRLRGMLGARERQDAIQRLEDQTGRLRRAFLLWNNGMPLSVDPASATLREDRSPAGGLAGPLDWVKVHACCKVLAEAGSEPLTPAPGVLYRLLKGRLRTLEKSLAHHPLYMPRLLATKARYWQAAAQTLEALLGPRDLASRSVQVLSPAPSTSQHDASDHKHALPGNVGPSRLKTTGPEARRAAPEPMAGDPIETACARFRWHHDRLMEDSRLDSNKNKLGDPESVLGLRKKHRFADWFSRGRDSAIRDARVEWALHGKGFPDHGHMSEEAFARACVKRVVAEARAAAKGEAASRAPSTARHWWSRRQADRAGDVHPLDKLTDEVIEQEFARSYSRLLSQQDNPVITSSIAVHVLAPKAPGGQVPADSRASSPSRLVGGKPTVPYVLHFEQRPAIAVSDALHDSFVKDGVQGAHCHERTQHKHAVNLFISRMKGEGGRRLLTITRHGVLAPNQLQHAGIDSLSDALLYQLAVDLADGLAGEPFWDTRLRDALGQTAADGTARTDSPPKPTEADIARIAALIRDASPQGGNPPRPALIDMIRRAASLNRAREAAQAALASLPDEQILRLLPPAAPADSKYPLDPQEPAAPVTVRLASVSLMTPDVFRGRVVGSFKDDELTMWRDQAQAWADLQSLGPLVLPMPQRAPGGGLQRDAIGRLVTAAGGAASAWRVKFDVAALNVPVNEWGTKGRVVGFFSRAHAQADVANRQALLKLLGAKPEAWAACRPGTQPPLLVDSWLGPYLQSSEVTEEEKRVLRTLATQIGSIYASNAHKNAAGDPYKLAIRLIVLANRLSDSSAVLVNCKSGKDRTSVAETEARQMALEIATTGEVPAVGAPVTALRSLQLGALHDAGGSPHVQAWNTGMAGTKVDQEAVGARFGLASKDRIRSFVGLSKHTQS